MKKIILLFVMFLGFGMTAQAQTASDPAYVEAKAEINRFLNYFELSDGQIDEIMPLLVKKHATLLNTEAEKTTKNEIRMRFATLTLEKLDANINNKIESNKELYNEIFGITY
jgi:hypothetical protein